MKTFYSLALVAVLAAAGVTVYAQLPKSNPPVVPGDLPPIVTDPATTIPKPSALPAPLPVPIPAPIPVPVPVPAPAPLPASVPVSVPDPTPLPTPPPVSPAPVIPAAAPPMLPSVPPPTAETPTAPQATAPVGISVPVEQPKLPTVPPPTTPTPPLTQVPPTVAPTMPVATAPVPAPLAKQFIVLKDDKLIEGTVKTDGEKVIVKLGAIERLFTKSEVQFIGSTKEDVYRFVVSKAAANDPAARMSVARWCMMNGMRTHALIEAREVLRLDPKNASALQMVRVLEESLQKFPEEGAPAVSAPATTPVSNPTGPSLPPVPPPTPKLPPPMIPPAATSDPLPPREVVEPEPDLQQELAALFPTRIQPILVNQCADCHAKPGHTSAFRLARGTDFDTNPATAKPNLAAVLKQINRTDPAKSPLLLKSLTAHGGMQQPAFATRNIPGYRILEAWTYAAVGSPSVPAPPAAEPLAKTASLPPPPASSTSLRPPVAAATVSPLPPAPAQPMPALLPAPESGTFGQDAKPLPAGPNPASTGDPVDEFDPSVFNRSMHPGRK